MHLDLLVLPVRVIFGENCLVKDTDYRGMRQSTVGHQGPGQTQARS
jgi:hypothetical protein